MEIDDLLKPIIALIGAVLLIVVCVFDDIRNEIIAQISGTVIDPIMTYFHVYGTVALISSIIYFISQWGEAIVIIGIVFAAVSVFTGALTFAGSLFHFK